MRCKFLCLALLGLPLALLLGLRTQLNVPVVIPVTSHSVASDEDLKQPDAGFFGTGEMFDKIASVYDINNRLMSLGADQDWRRTLVNDCLQVADGDVVLDLATGTADVALLAAEKLPNKGKVFGVDPSIEQLKVGQSKIHADPQLPRERIQLLVGDAQNLTKVSPLPGAEPFGVKSIESDSVDKIAMSFGIRNVKNRLAALKEMYRVLKKTKVSRVCIMEFNIPDPSLGPLSYVARYFIESLIPVIGSVSQILSSATPQSSHEYQYLAQSIESFPSPEKFSRIMYRAGLVVESVTHLSYGAVQVYSARVQ